VFVINETVKHIQNRTFNIGLDVIKETDSHTHLGLLCDVSLSNNAQIREASIKLRGTYMSIVKNGIQSKNINSIVLRTIYKSVVIPKALFGCETWNHCASSDMKHIETAHRFCVKHMQRFSKYTNTAFSYLTIDLVPVQLEIDYRKLLMFGQLCRLDASYLAKQIFVHRLGRFVNLDRQSRGFTPDMFRLLQKYELVQYLEVFCTTGVFPSKFSWERTLKSMIFHKWKSKSLESLMRGHSDIPVSNALGESGCSPVWQLAARNRRLHRVCGELLVCLGKVNSKPFPQKCKKCNLLVDNLAVTFSVCVL